VSSQNPGGIVVEEAPLFGRDEELDMLQQIFRRAVRQGSAELVTVTGEQGLGKSRLVGQFLQWAETGPEQIESLLGRCLPYGLAFWALGAMIKARLGIQDSDGPDEASRKLGETVASVVNDRAEEDWLVPRLAPLVGAAEVRLEGGIERGEWFAAWRMFLEHLAAQHPLVLVFEDIHWADPSLLEFLEYLLDWTTGVPILVLCTADPEFYDRNVGWGGGKRSSTTIVMSPLSEAETGRLIETLIVGAPLPQETRTMLIDRSGGNPLYAEQFVRMLADQGITAVDPDVPVPGSVRSLISSRLASLSHRRRLVLQDAAVIGRVFWADAVAVVGTETDVLEHLHQLVRMDFIRPARTSSIGDELEYSFLHALVRDVAYANIPVQDRWSKHQAAARWLEEHGGDRGAERAEILAGHYLRALEDAKATGKVRSEVVRDLEDRAIGNLVTSGDQAIQLDVARARSNFRRALELLPEDRPEVPTVLARAAEASYLLGDFPQAVADYDAAIKILRSAGNSVGAAKVMLEMAYAQWNQGWTGPSRELLAEAVAILEAEPPGPELASAYAQMAGDVFFGGRSREALEWCEKALAAATPLGMKEVTVRVREIRGMARCDVGDWDGLEDLHEALRMALGLGLGQESVRAYINLGTFITPVEGPAKALELYRSAIKLADRRGIPLLGMWTKAWSCGVLFELGRWDELITTAREVVDWERGRGQSQFVVGALLCEAQVRAYRGELELGAELVEEFLPRAREILDPQVLVPALAVGAVVREAQGDVQGAVSLIEELGGVGQRGADWTRMLFLQTTVRVVVGAGRPDLAEQLMEGVEARNGRERNSVLTSQAVLAEARGELEEASAAYVEAANRWRDYGFGLEEGWALLGAGRVLMALRKAEDGHAALSKAREIFGRLRAERLMAETDALLG
jgi:tetratricopeptide (TPR) repeat protein